jgi:hypothetical protein
MKTFIKFGFAAVVVAQLFSATAFAQSCGKKGYPVYRGGYGYAPRYGGVCSKPVQPYPGNCVKPVQPYPGDCVETVVPYPGAGGVVAAPAPDEDLPIVHFGEELTLDAQDQSYGPRAGFVVLQIGEVSLPAKIITWEDAAVTFVLPELDRDGETAARIVIALPNGSVVDSIDVQVAGAEAVADDAPQSDLDPLLGLWQAVTTDAAGNVNKVLMNMLPGGNAELTVPTANGSATVKGKVLLADGDFRLDLGTRVLTVGKVVSAAADKVVLQRAEGQINFTRP